MPNHQPDPPEPDDLRRLLDNDAARIEFAASIAVSSQTVLDRSGVWVDGAGGHGRPTLAGTAGPYCWSVAARGPPRAVRSQSACRTAGCLGERTVSPQEGHALRPPHHPWPISKHSSSADNFGGALAVDARPGACAASILLVARKPNDPPGDPCRIPRRSSRRSGLHPENRRPSPGVLAAHGGCRPTLMSATHWR